MFWARKKTKFDGSLRFRVSLGLGSGLGVSLVLGLVLWLMWG